jgi:hypothetical protein
MTLRTDALHGRTRADRLRNLSDTVHGFQQRGQFAGRCGTVDIDHVNDSGRFPGLGVEAAGSGHAHAVNDDAESFGLSEDVVQHAPGDRQMQHMSPGEGRLYGDSFSRPPMWKPDDVSRHAPQRSSPRNSIKLVHTDDGATSPKTRPPPALTARPTDGPVLTRSNSRPTNLARHRANVACESVDNFNVIHRRAVASGNMPRNGLNLGS